MSEYNVAIEVGEFNVFLIEVFSAGKFKSKLFCFMFHASS